LGGEKPACVILETVTYTFSKQKALDKARFKILIVLATEGMFLGVTCCLKKAMKDVWYNIFLLVQQWGNVQDYKCTQET